MRIQPRQKEESVYVSLSDLLMTTMAIFVLLMIIAMAQNKPDREPEVAKLKEELTKASESLAKTSESLAKAVQTHPLELVIAIDVSRSMRVPLDNLKDAIKRLAAELPRVVDLKIGVVAYGGGEAPEPRKSREFSLREIAIPSKSLLRNSFDSNRDVDARLLQYLDGEIKNLSGGNVDVVAALTTALGMFGRGGAPGARRVFVLIGDVGPYERYGEKQLLDYQAGGAVNRQYEGEAYDLIRQFVADNESASVLAMYTGNATKKPSGSNEESSYGVIQYTVSQTTEFFHKTANLAGDHGWYSEDPGDILPKLLMAMLTTDKSHAKSSNGK